MSRHYQMDVLIQEHNKDKRPEIFEAIYEQWPFEDDECSEFGFTGRSSLCGGEGEDEFAERIAHAIWKANGDFCVVRVTATCLDNLPYHEYKLKRKDYEKFFGKTSVATEEQIKALRVEAAKAGDAVQVATCDRALAGDTTAVLACAEAIADAAASR